MCSSEIPADLLTLSHNSAADCSNAEPAQARKLSGSSAEAPSYQNLHRELLLSHKRYRETNSTVTAFTKKSFKFCVFGVYLSVTVPLIIQGPPAGGETRAETSVGAAQTGAAQGGGDGTTGAVRSRDGAPQEAAKAAGGQVYLNNLENFQKSVIIEKYISDFINCLDMELTD